MPVRLEIKQLDMQELSPCYLQHTQMQMLSKPPLTLTATHAKNQLLWFFGIPVKLVPHMMANIAFVIGALNG